MLIEPAGNFICDPKCRVLFAIWDCPWLSLPCIGPDEGLCSLPSRQPPSGPPGAHRLGWGWDKGAPGAELFPESPFPLGIEKSWAAWRKRQPAQPKLLVLASASWTSSQPATDLGHPKDMQVSGLCRVGGRTGSGFSGSETAQSWNPAPTLLPPLFQLHVLKQWAPLSLAFIKTKQGKILRVAVRTKYFKCLVSYRYSVNMPLFTFGFCHKDSWVILSGISPLGNGVGGRGLRGLEGGGQETCEKCGPTGQTSRPEKPIACGSGERPAQCKGCRKAGGRGWVTWNGERNRMIMLILPPCGHPALGWFRSLFWAFTLLDPPSSQLP